MIDTTVNADQDIMIVKDEMQDIVGGEDNAFGDLDAPNGFDDMGEGGGFMDDGLDMLSMGGGLLGDDMGMGDGLDIDMGDGLDFVQDRVQP